MQGLQTSPPQRALIHSETEITGGDVSQINIYYPNRTCTARFNYNQEERAFDRFSADKPHLTTLGKQLQAANVIIQYVETSYADGDGHLKLTMIGKGDALICRGGKALVGRWQKNKGELTRFTDLSGKVALLMEGPTWIEIVPKGIRVDYGN
jgi:hypothetical protein